MTEYTIMSKYLELPYGSRFTYHCLYPIETGELCLLRIGSLKTVGRYYKDVAGFDWIIQPGRILRVIGKVIVEILGLVRPLAV